MFARSLCFPFLQQDGDRKSAWAEHTFQTTLAKVVSVALFVTPLARSIRSFFMQTWLGRKINGED